MTDDCTTMLVLETSLLLLLLLLFELQQICRAFDISAAMQRFAQVQPPCSALLCLRCHSGSDTQFKPLKLLLLPVHHGK